MSRGSTIVRAAALAGTLSGLPSTGWALARTRSPAATARSGTEATRAIATIATPGRPGLGRGALVHAAISLGVAAGLDAILPRDRPPAAPGGASVADPALLGALAGLGFGVVALGVVAPRRFPDVAALPLAPQLLDNAAFGAIAGWVLRR